MIPDHRRPTTPRSAGPLSPAVWVGPEPAGCGRPRVCEGSALLAARVWQPGRIVRRMS